MTTAACSNSQRFLDAYNRLDHFMRDLIIPDYDSSHSDLISEVEKTHREIKHKAKKLRSFARLRNAIIHNPDSRAQPIAEPHDLVVREYEELVERMIRPPKANQHWIPKAKVFSADATTPVVFLMKKMVTASFSHVPLMNDGVVTGVFSEWTPLEIARDTGELLIDDSQLLSEFLKWTDLSRPTIRNAIRFAEKDATISDVRDLFRSSYEQKIRLGVIFFTENGQPTERMLGLITPWDIVHLS